MINMLLYYVKLFVKHFRDYKWSFLVMVSLSFLSSLFDSIGILLFLPMVGAFTDIGEELSFIEKAIRTLFKMAHLDMTILNLALLMVLLFTFKALFRYYAESYNIKFSNRYRVDSISKLFATYFDTKWTYFIDQKRGYLIDYILTVCSRNMTLLENLGQAISALLALGVYIAFSLLVSTGMTIFAIGFILVPLLFYTKILAKIRQYGQRTMKAGNDLSKLVEQYLSGAKSLRTFNAADTAKENVRSIAQVRMNNFVGGYLWRIGFNSGIELFVSLILVGLLVVFINFLKYPLTEMVVVLVFMAKTFQKINAVQRLGAVATNVPGIQLMEKVYNGFEKHLETPPISIQTAAFNHYRKKIELRNLSYSYSPNPSTGHGRILQGISFNIRRGCMCGIVGGSGVGKTTLIDLIMGLLKPTEGDLYVDDKPLSQINPYHWRSMIGYVPQDGFLLNDTIYNNISFFRDDIDESDIIEASVIANCYDFIRATEQGFQTLVGDNGIKLSGGEKQRVCLARALAGKPKILILDEATSSLDTHAESIIQEAIENLRNDLTIIIVAHRLSTVLSADQIIVLDKGKIGEIGIPEKLLSQNGLFKEMYNKQMRNQPKERL